MRLPPLKLLLAAFIVFLGAFLLYSPVLLLPNIYDTLLHIRINGGLTFANVWLPTDAFGFYRPFTFAPMLLVRALFGDYPAWLLSLLNITHHAVDAALLIWLIQRLTGKYLPAILAGILFAIFPFSYQAVAVYGHNVHPQLVTVLLVNLHQFISALNNKDASPFRRWRGVLIVFVIGLLTHESYVLAGPFAFILTSLFLIELPINWQPTTLTQYATRNVKQFAPAILLTLTGTLYILLYQFLPISRAPQADSAVGSFGQKALYLVQGVTWPFGRIGNLLGIDSAQTIILVALAITLLLSVIAWRRQWQLLLFGWGWWLLASILIAIPLPTGYLLNGPRLLYLGSIGVALIWAAILSDWFDSGRFRQTMATVALLFMLFVSVQFIGQRLAAYAELTQGIGRIRQSKTQALVLVNLPQWLAPVENSWPVGAEFVQQLGPYLFAEEWTGNNLLESVPTAAVKVDEVLSQVRYGYEVHNQAEWDVISAEWPNSAIPSDVYITRYLEDGTTFDYTGRFTPWQYDDTLATFDSYVLHSAEAYYCDEDVRLTSVWSYPANQPPPGTVSIFAQLLNGDGTLASQNDGGPLGLPTTRIELNDGWQLVDVRNLTTPEGNLPDILNGQVLLGVYDFTTGTREVALSNGESLADNAVRLPITYCR